MEASKKNIIITTLNVNKLKTLTEREGREGEAQNRNKRLKMDRFAKTKKKKKQFRNPSSQPSKSPPFLQKMKLP